MNIDSYKKIIKSRMSDYRYKHSVNVAKEAVRLAKKYGADEEKAAIAGILHDITKENTKEEQLQIMTDGGIILDDVQKISSKLWHGISGSVYMRDKLDITDEDILNAIRYHTTGRPAMTLLEKIVFVADYIEPNRNKADHLDELRRSAFENLDETVLLILDQTLDYLETSGKDIDQQTVITRDYYRDLLRSSNNE